MPESQNARRTYLAAHSDAERHPIRNDRLDPPPRTPNHFLPIKTLVRTNPNHPCSEKNSPPINSPRRHLLPLPPTLLPKLLPLGTHQHRKRHTEAITCVPEETAREGKGDPDVVAFACREVGCGGEEEEWVPEAEDYAGSEGLGVVWV
jgi:hypothetical protein